MIKLYIFPLFLKAADYVTADETTVVVGVTVDGASVDSQLQSTDTTEFSSSFENTLGVTTNTIEDPSSSSDSALSSTTLSTSSTSTWSSDTSSTPLTTQTAGSGSYTFGDIRANALNAFFLNYDGFTSTASADKVSNFNALTSSIYNYYEAGWDAFSSSIETVQGSESIANAVYAYSASLTSDFSQFTAELGSYGSTNSISLSSLSSSSSSLSGSSSSSSSSSFSVTHQKTTVTVVSGTESSAPTIAVITSESEEPSSTTGPINTSTQNFTPTTLTHSSSSLQTIESSSIETVTLSASESESSESALTSSSSFLSSETTSINSIDVNTDTTTDSSLSSSTTNTRITISIPPKSAETTSSSVSTGVGNSLVGIAKGSTGLFSGLIIALLL